MKKALLIVLLLGGLSYAAYALFFAPKKNGLSVLVFSKTEQFRHGSIEAGIKAIKGLGKKHDFSVKSTEDPNIFNEKDLKPHKVVVFLNTTGDILTEAQQLEFNRFIQAGGGYVGIHAAADTEYDWEWYGKLVGAYFNGHPNNPNVREADILMVDSTHQSSSMLPQKWHCTDEWYNYKNINPNINVLLNLDESSYEGGTNGVSHPIAWYHEYDGGRAWYTGRGHTDETFAEPLYLEHLWGGIDYVAGDRKPVDYNNASVASEENRFTKEVLADNLNEPMELDLLPNGNVLFVERGGKVKLYDSEAKELKIIHEIEVYNGEEDGLMGIALDPNFAENHWVYLCYSHPEKVQQHVSRFTMIKDNTAIDASSEKVVLEIPTQRDECCHSGGSLEFDANGLLYISVGDDTNPHKSDGYAPIDDRKGRKPFDARRSSANSQDLRGKILRIKPEADGTYTIPASNLFANAEEGRPEIYVMGCRNPFRIAIDNKTGYLYWGDVGPDANNDEEGRGARGHDEVNQAREAGFFGWPLFIADNKPYNDYDFAKKISNDAFDPAQPLNESANNTGIKTLPPAQPAFIWYPYANSKEFPAVGEGGRNAMAGGVFHLNDYPETEERFPEYYDGKLFIYDWMRGWMMAVTMSEAGDFERMERFLPSFEFNNPMDMLFSPQGDIFMLEYGTLWFSENKDARLVHLTYNSGNRPPEVALVADKKYGQVPLTVAFDATTSKDPDGDELTYAWYLDGTENISSTEAKASHTFNKAGEYTAKLVVTDKFGNQSEITTNIVAGNSLPKVAWELEGNQTFYWDKGKIAYRVVVDDEEDGNIGKGIDPSSVNVTIDYLERGFDENEVVLGHQAVQEASANLLGKQLMEQSDCKACHQIAVKSVGPSYQQVAEKYQSQEEAMDYVASKIIKGGVGIWGEIAMAAHDQISESEAQQMAKYILSLGKENQVASSLAYEGNYAFDQHQAENTEGKYILRASYKDKGGKGVGALRAQDVRVLRSPVMRADAFDENKKVAPFTVEPEMSQGMLEEALDIIICEKGGYARYSQIDLTHIKTIAFDYMKAGPFFDGGKMHIRLDSPVAKPIASVDFSYGLTDIGSGETSINFPETTAGQHDLYLTFEGEGDKPVAALVTLRFGR